MGSGGEPGPYLSYPILSYPILSYLDSRPHWIVVLTGESVMER